MKFITQEVKRLLCYPAWKDNKLEGETLDDYIDRMDYSDESYEEALESVYHSDYENRNTEFITSKLKKRKLIK